MPPRVLKGRDVVPFLDVVRKHADSDKRALGFLPESAYSELAAAGKLYVVVSDATGVPEVVGHLLYGGTYPHIHVHQVHVLASWRRKHVASLLVGTLIRDAEEGGYLSVSARVATDLEAANAFWESAGLFIVRSKPGGLSRGRTLNIRVRELDTPKLFHLRPEQTVLCSTLVPDRVSAPVPSYMMDVNVFLDVVKSRANSEQAQRLLSASFSRSVDVYVSEEFVSELRRAAPSGDDPVLAIALTLRRLRAVPQAKSEELIGTLAPTIFPERSQNGTLRPRDRSDLLHLATAIYHELNGFITSEKGILKHAPELRQRFGLDIVGTVEFSQLATAVGPFGAGEFRSGASGESFVIGELAEEDRQKARAFLQATGISDQLITTALASGGQPLERRRMGIQSSLSGEFIGFASWDAATRLRSCIDAYVFVDEDHADAHSMAAHLLRELIRDTSANGPCLIDLRTPEGHFRTRSAAFDIGFRSPGSTTRASELRKIAIGGAVTSRNWPQFADRLKTLAGIEFPTAPPEYSGPEAKLRIRDASGNELAIGLREAERLFSPAIFAVPGRCGVLVPIRRQYAEHLFSGAPQLSLLPRKQAALFSERAYFRTPARTEGLLPGTPVVFYESAKCAGRACAFASAVVTSNRVVWTQTLSDRVLVKGVLDRGELQSMSKKGLISMLNFDDVVMFRHPVGLKRLRDLKAIDAANAIAPRKLDPTIMTELLTEASVLAL